MSDLFAHSCCSHTILPLHNEWVGYIGRCFYFAIQHGFVPENLKPTWIRFLSILLLLVSVFSVNKYSGLVRVRSGNTTLVSDSKLSLATKWLRLKLDIVRHLLQINNYTSNKDCQCQQIV